MPEADESTQRTIEALYENFNARNTEAVLAGFAPDVHWPNGWEGGFVSGHEEVAEYWRRQWAEIDPRVTPTAIAVDDEGRVDVTVHQVVRSLTGELIADVVLHHLYTFAGGLVERMEIQE